MDNMDKIMSGLKEVDDLFSQALDSLETATNLSYCLQLNGIVKAITRNFSNILTEETKSFIEEQKTWLESVPDPQVHIDTLRSLIDVSIEDISEYVKQQEGKR